jgi:hypothetical protein
MLGVTMKDDRLVFVDDVQCSTSNLSWLAKGSDVVVTVEMLRDAAERGLGRHGIGTYVVPPQIDMSKPKRPQFPPVEVRVRAFCTQPVRDPKQHGSQMCIVFFVSNKELSSKSLERLVEDNIREVPWDEYAEDFQW